MKKLIFLVALVIGMITSTQAQMLTTYGAEGQSWFKVTTNYTLTNTTAAYWQIETRVTYPASQVLLVNLDTLVSGQTNMAVALYGRTSSIDPTWTAIGSPINWKYTTGDTTIVLSNTTENRYRQYKVLFTGTGTGKTTISDMEFKVYSPD